MNSQLIKELQAGGLYADHQGYWKSRGYQENPGWAAKGIPFADFFENLSDSEGDGHKKMWLNPDGSFKEGKTSFECEGLMPLYGGIVDTQQQIVSACFFMYSASVVSLHLNLAFYSRKLGCSPDLQSCYNAGSDKVKEDLEARALACRIVAFIGYEGDGLGGFSEKVWPFYGRLFGKVPQGVVLTDQDGKVTFNEAIAKESKDKWDESTDEERQELFYQWWSEIHPGYKRAVVNKIYSAFKILKRYQMMESPNCPPDMQFNPEVQFDVQAAICGFFRRSAVGLGEARAYDANEFNNPANRFSDMLTMAQSAVERLVTGHKGVTPFGEYLLEVLDLQMRRNALVDNIVARQQDDEETKKQSLAEGFRMRVSKRGRARL